MQLKGKRAVITGAAGGIGTAIAKRYAEEGIHLVLIDKNFQKLEDLDDLLAPYGVETTLVPLDLTEHSKVEMLGPRLAQRFGHIDIFVHCVAISGMLAPLHSVCMDVWQSVLQTNITALFSMIKTLEPLLKKAAMPRARIVSCSLSRDLKPYWGPYAVSQVAVESLVKLWSKEVARTIPHLDISLLDPGQVNTPLWQSAFPGQDFTSLPHPDDISDLFVESLGISSGRDF